MPDIWMDVDAALSEVPVNILPLIDDSDFKTRETAVAFNAAGMDLVWNFITTGGSFTQTAVTPTSGGTYDWTHQGDGMYTIEIPASGGASINNDSEGFGWFTGVATGVLPWRGPAIGFRAAGLNNKLIDDAYSTTRGLAGTALPDAAADAAGGLPISDAGGLDMDAILADTADMQPKLGTISDLGGGATIGANLVAIEAQTDDIGAAGAGLSAIPWNSAWDAEVQSEVADALNAYDPPTNAELVSEINAVQADIAALNDLSAAEVNAEVVDALTVDTYAEPDAVPAATSNLKDKINWLFALARNKITQTATTQTLRNDDDDGDIATAGVSDDGTTAVRDEWS